MNARRSPPRDIPGFNISPQCDRSALAWCTRPPKSTPAKKIDTESWQLAKNAYFAWEILSPRRLWEQTKVVLCGVRPALGQKHNSVENSHKRKYFPGAAVGFCSPQATANTQAMLYQQDPLLGFQSAYKLVLKPQFPSKPDEENPPKTENSHTCPGKYASWFVIIVTKFQGHVSSKSLCEHRKPLQEAPRTPAVIDFFWQSPSDFLRAMTACAALP